MRLVAVLSGGLLCVALLAGCAAASATQEAEPTPCAPPPVVAPTVPAEIPDYVELDSSTGLHMTGKYQEIDLDSYRLVITGNVEHALSLTYDELRCMPRVEATCTLVCPGFFEDEGTWAGVPITHVLGLAQPGPDVIGLRLVSADGYDALATLDMVESQGAFLAYEWGSEPVPILHGFPVRAVFPESSGSVWVKWLVEIEVY